jgi:hypothetical protein
MNNIIIGLKFDVLHATHVPSAKPRYVTRYRPYGFGESLRMPHNSFPSRKQDCLLSLRGCWSARG